MKTSCSNPSIGLVCVDCRFASLGIGAISKDTISVSDTAQADDNITAEVPKLCEPRSAK
jgi:hypothetical protein